MREDRVTDLVTFAYPRMEIYEATLKAALRLALDQWARRHAGLSGDEAQMVRGHRIGLLNSAVQPLKGRLGRAGFERLTQSLSLVFGTEAFVVLKDIWGLDRRRAEDVALWTCHALIQAAVAEDGKALSRGPVPTGKRNGVIGDQHAVEKEGADEGKVETAICWAAAAGSRRVSGAAGRLQSGTDGRNSLKDQYRRSKQ